MSKAKGNYFIYLILLLIGSMPLLDLIYPGRLESVSRVFPILLKIILLGCLIIYVILYQKKWWYRDSIGKVIILFLGIHFFYYIISSSNYSGDFFYISKTLIWSLGFFFFLDLGYRKSLTQRQINRFFTVVVVLLFCLILTGVSNELLFRANKEYAASNFAYFLVFVFPFIFMHKKLSFRLVILILCSIGVAISFKRGTMLLYLFMIFYIIFFGKLKVVVGNSFSKYFKLIIISIIALVIYLFVFSNMSNYLDKFQDIINLSEGNIDDVGSGRGLLYRLPLERWLSSNPFRFLFGFGFNATPAFYPTTGLLKTEFYAHSDFVMLIHDYGFLGLSILMSLFYSLLMKIKRSISYLDKTPLILIFFALLLKAVISGFIIYEYSIYAFSILGLIIGRIRRAKVDNILKNEIKNI
jgi:hypothetical protein